MSKKVYIILIIGIALILIAIPIFVASYNQDKNLEVDYLDVGQGDAILIKTSAGQNILIDGGPDNIIIERLSENLPWWDKQIDLMILTHPHDDHVNGLINVIKRFDVKKILYTGVVHTSPSYLEWLELIKEKHISLYIIENQQIINLGEDCKIEILYPFESLSGQVVNNLNNSSIVMKLIYRNNSFLFTGDIEAEIENFLLEKDLDLEADVFKAGHHGSDTSNTEEFLQAVQPAFAVIQVGQKNDFGHPSRRTLKRLERLGTKIFRNDIDGTVRFFSNGYDLVFRE